MLSRPLPRLVHTKLVILAQCRVSFSTSLRRHPHHPNGSHGEMGSLLGLNDHMSQKHWNWLVGEIWKHLET